MKTIQKRQDRINREKVGSTFDYTLLLIVIFLLGFGMIMIYSASSYSSAIEYNDAAYFLKKQIKAVALGTVAMFIVSFIPVQLYSKRTITWYAIGLGSLILLLTPLAITANGATRWLNFKILTMQPAELVKLCMILFYASLMCKMEKATNTMKGYFFAFLLPFPMAGAVYLISDNLSSAIIVLGICFLMLAVASKNVKCTLITSGAILLLVGGVVGGILLFADPTKNFRFARIFAWIHPENYSQGTGFQTLQSLYAIGSGGVFGKGLGQSIQKMNYIPEAQNDMIFSVICEELGLFGAFAVLALFVALLFRCLVIIVNAKDMYSQMVAVGIMSHFAIQVILNIAVVTNTFPNTGVSLPFISYGGSSVLFLLVEIGMLLSIASGRTWKAKGERHAEE